MKHIASVDRRILPILESMEGRLLFSTLSLAALEAPPMDRAAVVTAARKAWSMVGTYTGVATFPQGSLNVTLTVTGVNGKGVSGNMSVSARHHTSATIPFTATLNGGVEFLFDFTTSNKGKMIGGDAHVQTATGKASGNVLSVELFSLALGGVTYTLADFNLTR